MSTAKPARSLAYSETSEPTVDELLEDFGLVDDHAGGGIHSRLAQESVETSQEESTEELIAPEVLFPDECAESG